MDSKFGDEPIAWGQTYRMQNYEAVISKTEYPKDVRRIIRHANDQLLKPENMDFVIWQVYKAFYHDHQTVAVAADVAAFIRSIFEDKQFHWGNRWMRHNDAHRYARGVVEQILGQNYK